MALLLVGIMVSLDFIYLHYQGLLRGSIADLCEASTAMFLTWSKLEFFENIFFS